MIKQPKNSLPLALVILGITSRFLPHPPNFTAVNSTALFGGNTLKRPWNYLVPLTIMALTDIFLGFHATMPYVYASFLLTAFIGEKLLKKPTVISVTAAAIISSILFFLITNYGVWAQGRMYPLTAAGLIECYIMGIPFAKNMLAADLIFSLGFFATYSVALNGKFNLASEQKLEYLNK